ncbi:MAG: OmpA family protein [Bacteroidetes bacterium]|nr:OmpA family protein [Bacteroidota bacterium]MBL0080076.1 OmpA family protein [Bacteroidota bacterium]MBL0287399.1 OmpA family protein [Bacteroidota bacterium]
MIKKIVWLLVVCGNFTFASAQSDVLKSANKLFDKMGYAEAIPLFLKANEKENDPNIAIKLAECYRLTNQYSEAISWYDKVVQIANINPDYNFNYGELLRNAKNYSQAKIQYLEYAKSNPSKGNKYAQWCDLIPTITADSNKYLIEKPRGVNSKRDDFGPVYHKNGLVYASSGLAESASKGNYSWDGFPFLDLYFVPIASEGSYGKAELMKGNINTKVHESSATFYGDTKMYFTRNSMVNNKGLKSSDDKIKLSIYSAVLSGDEWIDITPFEFNNKDYSVGHPSINKSGDTMYFASDMPGGFGESDIYVVYKTASGWSTPKNMGPEINSEGAEFFPTITSDGSLYFSSNGRLGYGGLDIFYSKPYSTDKWTEAKNMGFPINLTTDDFGIVFDESMEKGYFSSNRFGGEGGDDIYYFKINKDRKECTQKVEGKIIDEETGMVVPGVKVTARNKTTGEIVTTYTNDKGEYSLIIKCGFDYIISFDKDQFFRYDYDLNKDDIDADPFIFDKGLRKIEIDKSIKINNIYYDLDKYYIRPDAALELDKLVRLLQSNPKLVIELSSHTDCRASDQYNLTLSQNRAKAAVDYLVEHGIKLSRLFPKGYGERKLVNQCADGITCSEEEHAFNRRTEFKVIGFTGMKLKSIPLDSVPTNLNSQNITPPELDDIDFSKPLFLSPDYANYNTGSKNVYVINLGVFKNNIKDYYYNLTDLGVVSFSKTKESLIKYTLGTYYDYKTAESILNIVKSRGNKDAYLSATSNGKPIDIEAAKALEK